MLFIKESRKIMKQFPILGIVVLSGLLGVSGCKPSPPVSERTTAAAQATAPALTFFALNVGNSVKEDQSVSPLTMFSPKDRLIASVQTKGAAKDVQLAAKLISMTNGQTAGDSNQKIATTGPATTNLEFKNEGAWAVGRYLVEVTINGKLEGRQEIEVRENVPPVTPEVADAQ